MFRSVISSNLENHDFYEIRDDHNVLDNSDIRDMHNNLDVQGVMLSSMTDACCHEWNP